MAMNDTTISTAAPGTINVHEQVPAGGQSSAAVETKVTKPGKAVKPRKGKAPAATGKPVPTKRKASMPAPAAVPPKARRAMKVVDSNGDIGIKQNANPSHRTKADAVLNRLRTTKGTTIEGLMEATGWQAHSVRGFLSAVVRKKLGLVLASEVGKDGIRRYRIEGDAGIA